MTDTPTPTRRAMPPEPDRRALSDLEWLRLVDAIEARAKEIASVIERTTPRPDIDVRCLIG